MSAVNLKSITYSVFGILVLAYVAVGLFGPVDPETLDKYKITESSLRLIVLPLLLAISGIWACTAYGFVNFKSYGLLISGTPDGEGINLLANGLGIIALQLVLSGILNTVSSFESIENLLGGTKGVTIISSALSVGLGLLSFYILSKGAAQLKNSITKRVLARSPLVTIGLLSVAIIYIFSMIRGYGTHGSDTSIYQYIPMWAAIIAIALPTIASWYFAFRTIEDVAYYQSHVKGTLYKSALRLFGRGIYVILVSSVLSQLLGAIGSSLEDLSLAPLVGIVYALILVIGLGFLFIAQSAKKLRLIEEI